MEFIYEKLTFQNFDKSHFVWGFPQDPFPLLRVIFCSHLMDKCFLSKKRTLSSLLYLKNQQFIFERFRMAIWNSCSNNNYHYKPEG